jgi:hypothetical protein
MGIDNVVVFNDPDKIDSAPVSAALPVLEEGGGTVTSRAPVLPPDFPENALAQGDGSFVLTLDYPVTLRFRDAAGAVTEEKYPSLHLKRLNGKAQREIAQATGDDFRPQMIASSTGMSLGRARLVHDAMDASDIAAALIVVRFFTTPGRKTGR